MNYPGLEQFFKNHLRYKQHWNKKLIGLKDAEWQPLVEDTWLDGCAYSKGSLFKMFETINFGWIVFHPLTKSSDGNFPGKRIIKY